MQQKLSKFQVSEGNQLLFQGVNAAESPCRDAVSAAIDGCATDRSSYSETSGRAECEAAVPSAAAPSVGQVLALAGAAGTDWRVGFKPLEHVFII